MKKFITLCMGLLLSVGAWAQQTTASIGGRVLDAGGVPVPGATVQATHFPTNTRYGVIAREDGRFNLPNVRVGGPYMIEVRMVGYGTVYVENIHLALGDQWDNVFTLSESSTELGEVVATAIQNKVINSNRTGAADIITPLQLEAMPSLNRSVQEYARLVPQANGSNFAGQSSTYNTLTLDGMGFNNGFGVNGSYLGGGSGAQPISLDAIEQIQISIAPYDVRQGGFMGANMNAVTKSGSNEFKGAVYTYVKSPKLQGTKIGNRTEENTYFSFNQYGVTLSGPVIKDKLFFFANAEIDRREDPGPDWRARREGETADRNLNISQASKQQLDELSQFLLDRYGYVTGPYEGYNYKSKGFRLTFKLDYTLSERSDLSFKFSMLDSYKDQQISNSNGSGSTFIPWRTNRRAGQYSLPYFNSYYEMHNDYYAGMLELNTRFSNRLSNSLQVAYTAQRDHREQVGGQENMPLVEIGMGEEYRNNRLLTAFGYEPFTYGNAVNVDTWQVIDNLTYFAGSHELTGGLTLSRRNTSNGFGQFYQGVWRFDTLEDFYAAADGEDTAVFYGVRYPAQEGGYPWARLKILETALYAQDRISIGDRLKVTVGMRAEMPWFFQNLKENRELAALRFREGIHVDVSKMFDPYVQVLPRVGFNWDVFGDKSLQVRGGAGVFSSQPNYVDFSNQASNNGVLWGSYTANIEEGDDVPIFNRDPDVYRPAADGNAITQYAVDVVDPNFKYPKLLRFSAAADKKLGNGWTATIDASYAINRNTVIWRNLELPDASNNIRLAGADNRERLNGTQNLYPVGGNNAATPENPRIDGVDQLTNHKKGGWSYFTTLQLQKQARNFEGSVAYTFASGKSAADYNAARTTDPYVNELGWNGNVLAGRLIATASYRLTWVKAMTTTFGLVFEAQSGGRSSITYDGDLNNDGSDNDLIYVPRTQSEIALINNGGESLNPDQLWGRLNGMLNAHPYLNGRRGMYAERSGSKNPGNWGLDGRITHEFFIKDRKERKHGVRVELSVMNLHNLINKNWGIGLSRSNPQISFERLATEADHTNGIRVGSETIYPEVNQPVFSLPLDDDNNMIAQQYKLAESYSFNRRWQMQLGIRYMFN